MFYDKFVYLCEKKGTSPTQVRKDLNIGQSTMASWKSRGLTPSAVTIARLAEYFNVPVDYLLSKDDSVLILSSINEDTLRMFNILDLPPEEQFRFNKAMELFKKTQKAVREAIQNESFLEKLYSALPDESSSTFLVALQGLCLSLEEFEKVNPEGIYQLRSKYSKWNDDVATFTEIREQLNETGRREAIKRVAELAEVSRYQRQKKLQE